MKNALRLLAMACALVAAGCATSVRTSLPIGSTGTLGPDKALYGTWKGVLEKDKQDTKNAPQDYFVHFLRAGDTDTGVIWVQAPVKSDDNGTSGRYTITTAKLGDNRYMNAKQQSEGGKGDDDSSDYIPVLYRLDGASLSIYLMDLDETVAAIKAGAIEGDFSTKVSKDDKGEVQTSYEYAQITAGDKDLDTYFAKPEATRLFKLYVTLKRVE